MTLVLVPDGCFNMGFNGVGGRQCFDDPFWIDKYEVTNTDYARFMEAGGYADPGYWIEDGWAWLDAYQITQPEHWDNSDFNSPQQPVVGVSWYEALAYAQWVGVSLCTEAEWEYAARGPEELVYPWGNELIADNLVYSGNSNGQPSHTGSRLNGASWVGALDLSGNVWEWTRSEYRDYPYIMSDGREAINGYAVQVLRGGAWDYPYQFARTTSRLPSFPEDRRNDIGFRVCRS
ncbi:MAG: formylglycine-generating enzyme family protein [Anaerolineaceae bacterium]|nr:formylglycine-generating enzyme family protein [Anaerolineaceae bacterium]